MSDMNFGDQLMRWANKRKVSMHKAIAMTAIRLGANIIERTPIDTGRAKGNWMSAYGSADTGTSETRTQNEALQGLRVKFTVAQVAQNTSLLITNSLPYIIELEQGKSKQAPAGMVRLSILEFKQILEQETRSAN